MKQESQRRRRSSVLAREVGDVLDALQKQVGQTIVQLPQVRQRSATSSQRGCSRLPYEQVAEVAHVELAPHLPRRVDARRRARRVDAPPSRARVGQLAEHLRAALAADLDEEAVLAVEDLGQREVEAGLDLRAGAHRDAEARAARPRRS